MKQGIKAIVIAYLFFFMNSVFASQTPVGYWQILDNVSGKVASIVKIWETDDQTLMGRIIKVFPSTHTITNQPTVGSVIISGLKQEETRWHNDSVNLKVAEGGQTLTVENASALPQTWKRVDVLSESDDLSG